MRKSCFIFLLCFVIDFSLAKKNCVHDENNFRCVQYIHHYDGDTITFNIPQVHRLIGKKIRIRLKDIDAPELNSKSECEKKLARQSRSEVARLIQKAGNINLENVRRGHYFRIVADVKLDGRSLGEHLLKMNLARPYKDKTPWRCFTELPSQKKELSFLIVGDSLTAGYGVGPQSAFPHQLKVLLNQKFKNYQTQIIADGISGSTSASLKARLEKHLKKDKKPDVVMIILGGNDGLRGLSVSALKKNLQAGIDLALSHQLKVALAGMQIPLNYGEQYRKSFEQVYQELAQENKLVFIPFVLEKVGMKKELNLPDRIHPNPKGHKVIAETIWPHLKIFY